MVRTLGIYPNWSGSMAILCDFWSDIDFQNTQNQGNVNFENAKKPEQLLYRIIDMVTNNNDIVMDFNLGSGTTCAVAHKMGRKYIGIEQMDYIKNITVERLKKVIDGEQGGISKALNWKGGGDFVYTELKQIDNFKDVKIGALNTNMQYLPISEIEDTDYNISPDEIIINKAFYGIENE
jgi:adenine-specific DNA-methyltransferase